MTPSDRGRTALKDCCRHCSRPKTCNPHTHPRRCMKDRQFSEVPTDFGHHQGRAQFPALRICPTACLANPQHRPGDKDRHAQFAHFKQHPCRQNLFNSGSTCPAGWLGSRGLQMLMERTKKANTSVLERITLARLSVFGVVCRTHVCTDLKSLCDASQ